MVGKPLRDQTLLRAAAGQKRQGRFRHDCGLCHAACRQGRPLRTPGGGAGKRKAAAHAKGQLCQEQEKRCQFPFRDSQGCPNGRGVGNCKEEQQEAPGGPGRGHCRDGTGNRKAAQEGREDCTKQHHIAVIPRSGSHKRGGTHHLHIQLREVRLQRAENRHILGSGAFREGIGHLGTRQAARERFLQPLAQGTLQQRGQRGHQVLQAHPGLLPQVKSQGEMRRHRQEQRQEQNAANPHRHGEGWKDVRTGIPISIQKKRIERTVKNVNSLGGDYRLQIVALNCS